MRRGSLVSLGMLLTVAGTVVGQESSDGVLPPDAGCVARTDCGRRGDVWGGVDELLWWVQKGSVPPLVVTGPSTDAFPGALDQPGTRVLFGNSGLDYGMFNGLRATVGMWIDPEHTVGAEAGGFVLERRSVNYFASGNPNGQPFLAAPFVNALTGHANVYFISQNFANPLTTALLTGSVNVFSPSRLWGWEANGVANLARNGDWSMDLLAGYRQLSLRESLTYVTSASNLAVGGAAEFETIPLPPGFLVNTLDQFATENLFNGGQIGARVGQRWGRFSLDVLGKLALGDMHERVTIAGQTTTNAPFPVTTAVGGIYAQASNIGTYRRDVFAVIPEIGVNLGVDLTPHTRVRVGYDFLYVSSVVRPGNQMDTTINPHQVPIDFTFGTPGGPPRPTETIHSTGFWAQGINFGLEFRF